MSHRERGFSLVELTIVVAIVSMLAAIAVPTYTHTIRERRTAALATDAKTLYDALMRYSDETGNFPATAAPAERVLDWTTLSPLSTEGYFGNVTSFTGKLRNRRVIYLSPTIDDANEKFWSLLVLDADPRIVILVAHTDSFILDMGTWYDGVYYIVGDEIVPVSEA